MSSLGQRSKRKITDVKARPRVRGLMVVFTGDGKGKTTAALGSALRMIKHGGKAGVVHFFKSRTSYAVLCTRFKAWSFGGGFTWKTARGENMKAARKAWEKCRELLKDPKYNLVVLDEIHIALRHKLLKLSEVIKALKRRPALQHVILTGRHAPQSIICLADLVTEMKCVKHPFTCGVPAQPGIEF